MTTDMTTRDSNLPALPVPEGFDNSDISVPFVQLVQASSEAVKQRKAQPGAFLSSDGEQTDAIDLVPLHIQPVRDFYDKKAQKNVCSSSDRVTGYPKDATFFAVHGNIDVPEGEPLPCAVCPFADKSVEPGLGCFKGYVMTAQNLETEEPFMMRIRGTAVRPFKDRIISAYVRGKAQPWARQYQMTAELTSSKVGNSWFMPSLEPTKTFSDEEQGEWAAYAAGFGGVVVKHEDAEPLPFDE